MLDKVVTKEEALSKFHDGQTIMFGDWHGEFAADDLIDGLVERGQGYPCNSCNSRHAGLRTWKVDC